MLQNASAILSTIIKLPFFIKTLVLSIVEWPFYTGFTIFSICMKDTCIPFTRTRALSPYRDRKKHSQTINTVKLRKFELRFFKILGITK